MIRCKQNAVKYHIRVSVELRSTCEARCRRRLKPAVCFADECEEVELQVQKVIQEMENILGEPLQSYF